jgi:hypothetical protein
MLLTIMGLVSFKDVPARWLESAGQLLMLILGLILMPFFALQQTSPFLSSVPSYVMITPLLILATNLWIFRDCSIEIAVSLVSWSCLSLILLILTDADWILPLDRFGRGTNQEVEDGNNYQRPMHNGLRRALLLCLVGLVCGDRRFITTYWMGNCLWMGSR